MESTKVNNYSYIEAVFTSGNRAKLTQSGVHGLRTVFSKGRRLYPLEVFFRRSKQEANDLFERIKAGFYINEDVELDVARYIASPELGYLDSLLLFAYNEKNGEYEPTKTHKVTGHEGLARLKGQLHAVHGRQRTALVEAIDAGAYCTFWCSRAAYDRLNEREKIRTFRDLGRALSLAIEEQTIALKTFTDCMEALRHDSFKWPESLTRLGFSTRALSLPVNQQNTPSIMGCGRATYALAYDQALLAIFRGDVLPPEDVAWLKSWRPPVKEGGPHATGIWLDAIEYLLRKHHELSSFSERWMALESAPNLLAFREFLRSSCQELNQLHVQMLGAREPWKYADDVRGIREALAHKLVRASSSGLLARLCIETAVGFLSGTLRGVGKR